MSPNTERRINIENARESYSNISRVLSRRIPRTTNNILNSQRSRR